MTGSKPFNLAELWAKMALARQSIMVEDQAKLLNRSHAVANAHDAKYLGTTYNLPEEPVIHFGDNNNLGAPQVQHPAKSGTSPLLAGLIGAGLLASGIGIPAAGYFIAKAINGIKPAQSQTVINPTMPGDGNTKYQLRLLP